MNGSIYSEITISGECEWQRIEDLVKIMKKSTFKIVKVQPSFNELNNEHSKLLYIAN